MDITNLIPRVPDFPALTIRKSGHISIHQLTVDRYGLMGTKYVDLEFDAVETTLEIKPGIDDSDTPPIRFPKREAVPLLLRPENSSIKKEFPILMSQGYFPRNIIG